ncbi:sporulation-delaying protein SdpB family protein [Corynebacterium resistens]|uniref:sporulation-delaying protein SdpB family protein n=1 Tax=Corynebacterium resistens TaxID=258224 RepID=UPI002356FFA3|nr:sporulation-delaying protein SdpB family protein [Corynebacterium resistens]
MKEAVTDLYRHVAKEIEKQDHRTLWFAFGRSLLAGGQLLTLLATPIISFIVPVGAYETAKCDELRKASILCLGGPTEMLLLKRWILITILVAVVAGVFPRFTAPLHVWATFSMSTSFTLPDGGEAIAFIISVLILPLCLIDKRRNHWIIDKTGKTYSSFKKGICYTFSWSLRLQLAFVYLHSSIAKMGVEDWANGSAEYYIMRDGSFGVAGPLSDFFLSITFTPWGTLIASWAAILGGLAIGVGLLLGRHMRVLSFIVDVAFHIGIILTIGLWSFALVMIGSAALAANTMRKDSGEKLHRYKFKSENSKDVTDI